MSTNESQYYPPGAFLALSKCIDLLCGSTTCPEWRSSVPFGIADPPYGWLSHKVGDVVSTFPSLLSYEDYLAQTAADAAADDDAAPWYETAYAYAFRTPSTQLGDLTTPTALTVLLMLVLILRQIKSIALPYFSTLGRNAGRAAHGVNWERHNEERIVKFGEYVFRLIFHSTVSFIGMYYFWDKEWWTQPTKGGTESLFRGHPYHPIEPGMMWYYLVQSAYNVEALVSLAELSFALSFQNPIVVSSKKSGTTTEFRSPVVFDWKPTVRGDFREMAVHHVITNLLIFGSSYFRLTRIGSMVFLVHDLSDVPIDLSKLANFVKWKTTTVVCFVTMVLIWIVTRLTILPFVIYKSIIYESYILVDEEGMDAAFYYAAKPFFVALVGLIILLHLAWFLMFVKMGYVLVSKGETHDLSEHKSGEKHHHPAKEEEEEEEKKEQ